MFNCITLINSALIFAVVVSGGCSKKHDSPSPGKPRVTFTFADNKRPNGLSVSIDDGEFAAVSGGNSNLDTTHGYMFSVAQTGLNLSFEIPVLSSGSYSYKAFSPTWPLPLRLDQWEHWDGTYLDPDQASISISFSKINASSVDGEFNLNFTNGTDSVKIANGSFSNIPVIR